MVLVNTCLEHSFHSNQILLPAAFNSSIHHQAIDGRHCKVLCNHGASKNLKENADFIKSNMDSKIIFCGIGTPVFRVKYNCNQEKNQFQKVEKSEPQCIDF